MDWRQFAMDLETLNPDAGEEIFARHGASSITLTDASDRPVLELAPGETPLWRDTRITGLFSPDADLGALRTDLLQSLSIDDLPENEVAGRVNGGCVLALSGILSEQVDQVIAAYRPWIEFDEPVSRQQDAQTWARLTGRRIEG